MRRRSRRGSNVQHLRVDKRRQLLGDEAGGLKSDRRILGHHECHELRKLRRDAELLQRADGFAGMADHLLLDIAASKWRTAGEQTIKRAAERIDIGKRVRHFARLHELGGEVVGLLGELRRVLRGRKVHRLRREMRLEEELEIAGVLRRGVFHP